MKELKALFEARSVAVIGASPRAGSLGQRIVANLHRAGFTGPVLPVHPKHVSVLRIHCYRSVQDMPFVPDLAIICTPAAQVAQQCRQLGERGTAVVIVMARDPDGESAATPFKQALDAAAHPHGLRWLGPRSAGVQLPRSGLNASWMEFMPPPGKLALVSQSSSIAASVVGWAAERGIGFSSVVTLGDGGNIDAADVLDYLANDGRTQAILLHLDTIADGRKFMASARAVARLKPVVALWADSPVEAPTDDTPGVDHNSVCKAAFRRAGLLQVSEIGDWFDTVETIRYGRQQIGDRLAILSNGRGPAQLAHNLLSGKHPSVDLGDDLCADLGKILPKGIAAANPFNLGVDADGARYEAAMAALLSSGEVDALLVIVTPAKPEVSAEIAAAIVRVARSCGRTIMVCWLGGRVEAKIHSLFAVAEISLFDAPEKAVQAYLHMVRLRHSQEALRQIPERDRSGLAPTGSDLRLSDDAESFEFLRAYGAVSAAILHEERVMNGAAAGVVLAAFGFRPAAHVAVNSETVPLRITVGSDRVFGRAIEASVGSRRWTLLPALNAELSVGSAEEIGAELQLLAGHGIPAQAIVRVLVRIADLIGAVPEILGASIPGFGWDGDQLQPVQPRLWVAAYERGQAHLTIHPYPRETEQQVVLRDGRVALVRPLRPDEDVALLVELLANVSRDDLFLRFCMDIKEITPGIVARMARVDYDREMVFVALSTDAAGKPVALGVVDAFVSPGNSEAEFSILLRSDFKGAGLGKLLMQKIVAYCQDRKIGSIAGIVLKENLGMRSLATKLGFLTETGPDDDMVTVALQLAPLETHSRAIRQSA